LENACYHAVKNLSSSHVVSKDDIKYIIVVSSCMVVKIVVKIREEHRLSVYDNMVLRRIFGPATLRLKEMK
jgi:hypothetical protein